MNKDLQDLLKVCYEEEHDLSKTRLEELKVTFDSDLNLRQELADELLFSGMTCEVQTQAPRWLKLENLMQDEEDAISLESSVMKHISASDKKASFRRRFQIFSTLAAGLAIGFFSTSAAYGKNIFQDFSNRAVAFFESFENNPPLFNTGIPTSSGKWNGDMASIVPAENGIEPAHGRSMLKIINSEFQGEVIKSDSSAGTLFYLLDLKQYQLSKSQSSLCKITASFMNSSEQSTRYGMRLFALRENFEFPKKQTSAKWLYEESLSMSNNMVPFTTKGQWQPMTTELILPIQSRYVMLSLNVHYPNNDGQKMTYFKNHYVDDISVTFSNIQ
jgi:hypothetical protein